MLQRKFYMFALFIYYLLTYLCSVAFFTLRFNLVSLFYDISNFVGDKGVHTFPWGTSLKVNKIGYHSPA